MTATTFRAEQTMLGGRGRCGGDAQERAATNPVAALPCARTPLLHPLSTPLLHPLLGPSAPTVGVNLPVGVRFGLAGSVGKLQLWRATSLRWVAGAVVSGRPPTNGVGGLPAGSRGYCHAAGHFGWSYG